MSLLDSVASHIRRAKAINPRARISDFQMRVDKDRIALVNLKTGEVQIVPARGGRHFDEFETRSGAIGTDPSAGDH
jgi:hypothetical protein